MKLSGTRLLAIALCILGAILVLRAYGDHSTNDHYTGDYLSDVAGLNAAYSYARFGLIETKFLPALKSSDASPVPLGFYLHYPPLPYIVHSIPKIMWGADEFSTRLFVLALSLLSICFAYQVFFRLAGLLGISFSKNHYAALVPFIFLTPTYLCFADTINSQPTLIILFWACLLWSIQYFQTQRYFALAVVLLFTHVWVSFEWIIPVFAAFAYCAFVAPLPLRRRLLNIFVLGSLGIILPVILRLLLNAWHLGTIDLAIHDFLEVGQVRAGDAAGSTEYEFVKHISKIILAIPWFVGIPAALMAIVGFGPLSAKLKSHRQLKVLLCIWGVGSVSWQILMRQHGMVHAFTYINFSIFLLFWSALSFLVLLETSSKQVAQFLFVLQCIFVGTVVQSEVLLPVQHKVIGLKLATMCEAQKQELRQLLGDQTTGAGRLTIKSMKDSSTPQTCTDDGERSAGFLRKYLYFSKASY